MGADADFFCEMFSITEEGNFEANQNIIYQKSNNTSHLNQNELDNKVIKMKEKLFSYRTARIRPGLDQKILTSWNGLSISAFVSGYKTSGQEKYLERAIKAAHFVLDNLCLVDRLKHCYAGGKAKIFGYLDDYAFFVQALIDLASVDSNPIWLKKAFDFTESILEHFYDPKLTDFFYTANDQEKLIARTKNSNDGPLPSATSVAAFNLIKLSIFSGNESYRQQAEDTLDKYKQSFLRLPGQYANMIAAWDCVQSTPQVLVFIASSNGILDIAMLRALHAEYAPDKIVIIKEIQQDRLSEKIPDSHTDKRLTIFSDKELFDDKPTVYICNNYGCQAPINNLDSLKQLLKQE